MNTSLIYCLCNSLWPQPFSSLALTSWPSGGRSLCRLPSLNNSLRPPLEEQLQRGVAAPRWSLKAKTEFSKESAPSLSKQSITPFCFWKLDWWQLPVPTPTLSLIQFFYDLLLLSKSQNVLAPSCGCLSQCLWFPHCARSVFLDSGGDSQTVSHGHCSVYLPHNKGSLWPVARGGGPNLHPWMWNSGQVLCPLARALLHLPLKWKLRP